MHRSIRDSQLLPISRVNSYLSTTQLPEPSEYSQAQKYERTQPISGPNSTKKDMQQISASTDQLKRYMNKNNQRNQYIRQSSESDEKYNSYVDKRLLRTLIEKVKSKGGPSSSSKRSSTVEVELERHGSKINELVQQQNVLMTLVTEQKQEIKRLTEELGRVTESVCEYKNQRTPQRASKTGGCTPEFRTPMIERRNGYEIVHDEPSNVKYLRKKRDQQNLEQHIYSRLYRELATIF